MRRKPRYLGTFDRVRITREKDDTTNEYPEEGVGTTHFGINPEDHQLKDREILDRFKLARGNAGAPSGRAHGG